MEKCIYHRTKFIRSKEVSKDRAVKGRFFQQCLHPNFRKVIGDAGKVKCNGDLAKCQVDWDTESP